MQGIAEDNKIRTELDESRELLRAFADNLPQFVTLKDAGGRFQFVNKRFGEWTGYNSEDVIGKTVHEIYDAEQATQFAAQDMEAFESRSVLSSELELSYPDGHSRTVISTRFPIFSKNGDVIGLGTINYDISERMQVEASRRLALADAERANQAKSEFLAHMSHELRTPLNSILGFSQLLRAGESSKYSEESKFQYAGDIYASGKHLLALINDVLDVSKIESGEFMLSETVFDLNETLRDLSRVAQGMATSKGLKIEYIQEQDLPNIFADKRIVTQIVLNLLSNAVKFSAKGKTVKLSGILDQIDGITISVMDSGEGISVSNLRKIFEPFIQIRRTSQHAHDGTGLGLSLSKKLTELHGGSLELESQLGKGTTATVHFPPNRTIHRA